MVATEKCIVRDSHLPIMPPTFSKPIRSLLRRHQNSAVPTSFSLNIGQNQQNITTMRC